MPRGSGTAGGPPAHPPVAGPGSSQLLTQTLRGPHVRGVPGVCRMRKGADDDRDARHPPPHDRNESIPCVPARLPHLKPPDAAAAAARTTGRSPATAGTHRSPAPVFSPYRIQRGKAMAAVHYYLGRPARVWISAQSRRRPARPARTCSGPARSGIPGQPATGSTPSVPAAAHGPAGTSRRAGNPELPGTAASGLPPAAAPAPAGGLLARHRPHASSPTRQPQTLPAHIRLAAPIGQRGTGDLRQYAKNAKNESSNTLSNRPRLSRYDRTSPRGGRQSCRRRADHPPIESVLFPHAGSLPG